MQHPERGAALLEAVVALAVLSVVAPPAIGLAVEAMSAVRRAQDHETQVLAASRLLEAVVLWPSEDLDRRLGTRPQGPWLLTVERPAEGLYVLILSDSESGTALLLTAVSRPGRSRGEP